MQSNNHKPRAARPAAPHSKLHPRNRHRSRYDFARLIAVEPALGEFVETKVHGDDGIDFANPAAVKALNRALLKDSYGIREWDIPPQSLCPPVPGRADYLHYLADLLADSNRGVVPRTQTMQVLDIGTGASCIYPLIGLSEYGWRFVATDINAASLENAQRILDANPQLKPHITLRLQASSKAVFKGVVGDDDWFDLTLCNPPFHASPSEASEANQRKWANLGKHDNAESARLNFGGEGAELWCHGGEQGFILRMISESARIATRCFWFTTLVSKSLSLPAIYEALKRAKVVQHKTIAMRQGQKQSRLVAWTFLNPQQQEGWRKLRW
jgi:23S rRNA (adenine1618-N6)-methyltransferase